jgi:polysaccharide deacetylase family protein (PEP-CTERM system associated)
MCNSVQHALTIDVEDEFNILMYDYFGMQIRPTEAVVRATEKMLKILQDCNIRATFFVLGEVADTFPSLMRRMADSGHEVGVHGYRHMQFFRMTREKAFEELSRTKKIIEDITGQQVRGHRAPAFSIRPDTAWGLEIVAEAGFEYDSSIVPCKMRRYGWLGFPRNIHKVSLPGGATLIEAPLSTTSILGREMPVCGGGYLRHFPPFFTRWALRRVQKQRPAIVYVHPYDIDTGSFPQAFQTYYTKAGIRQRVSMYVKLRNRATVETKLRNIFAEHMFLPLGEVINNCLQQAHT